MQITANVTQNDDNTIELALQAFQMGGQLGQAAGAAAWKSINDAAAASGQPLASYVASDEGRKFAQQRLGGILGAIPAGRDPVTGAPTSFAPLTDKLLSSLAAPANMAPDQQKVWAQQQVASGKVALGQDGTWQVAKGLSPSQSYYATQAADMLTRFQPTEQPAPAPEAPAGISAATVGYKAPVQTVGQLTTVPGTQPAQPEPKAVSGANSPFDATKYGIDEAKKAAAQLGGQARFDNRVQAWLVAMPDGTYSQAPKQAQPSHDYQVGENGFGKWFAMIDGKAVGKPFDTDTGAQTFLDTQMSIADRQIIQAQKAATPASAGAVATPGAQAPITTPVQASSQAPQAQPQAQTVAQSPSIAPTQTPGSTQTAGGGGSTQTFRQWLMAHPEISQGMSFTRDPNLPDNEQLIAGAPMAYRRFQSEMGGNSQEGTNGSLGGPGNGQSGQSGFTVRGLQTMSPQDYRAALMQANQATSDIRQLVQGVGKEIDNPMLTSMYLPVDAQKYRANEIAMAAAGRQPEVTIYAEQTKQLQAKVDLAKMQSENMRAVLGNVQSLMQPYENELATVVPLMQSDPKTAKEHLQRIEDSINSDPRTKGYFDTASMAIQALSGDYMKSLPAIFSTTDRRLFATYLASSVGQVLAPANQAQGPATQVSVPGANAAAANAYLKK